MYLVMTDTLPPATDRFACTIEMLCQAIAARGPKAGVFLPLLNLAWSRVRRTGARFARLAARVRSGELPAAARRARSLASDQPAEFRADRETKQRKSDEPVERRAGRLPRGYAWLFRLVPEAPCYGSQLNYLLSDPEMKALLAAAPQMGRLLRPLCEMLGVKIADHPLLHTRRMREAASAAAAPADAGAPARNSAGTTSATRRTRHHAGRPAAASADASVDAVAQAGVIASADAVAPARRSARKRRPAETVFYAGLQPPVRLPDVPRTGEQPPWAEPIRPIKR